MLRSLTVEGFGLIERTSVELEAGLNAFTGETGGGKSMVVDALGFVFGDRAGADLVRAGSPKAAVFAELEPTPAISTWLQERGLEAEGEVLVLNREMTSQGRTSARVNGKPVTASQLRELADIVLDVVGQHEHQHLLQPSRHLALLDAFAGGAAGERRAKVASLAAELRATRTDAEKLRADESQALRAIEDAKYAAREIAEAKLEPGELESLRERRALLANAAKIAQAVDSALAALDDPERGATTQLGRAATALAPLAPLVAQLRDRSDELRGLQSAAQDVSFGLAALTDDAAFDPAQLDEVEDRLALLERILKKYGPTAEEAVAAEKRFTETARKLEHRGEEIAKLDSRVAALLDELTAAAMQLRETRLVAARALSATVESELHSLGMRGATFRCAVDPLDGEPGPTGADRVEFYAALNPKEPERSIAKAASGGELSRMLLALKLAFAEVDPHPVVVLDEIDAGIGGATARAVGERIAQLARNAQVLCVTHLAQIATFAGRHVVMSKVTSRGRATIAARFLSDRAEVRAEVARMLAGDAESSEALKHAESLLKKRA